MSKNKTIDVLLPTGSKVPMENYVTKAGKQGNALLGTRNDGGKYFSPYGVDVIPPANHVPTTVTVLGVEVAVAQRTGFRVQTGTKKVTRKGITTHEPIMTWEDDPNGEPEVNKSGNPVYRGTAEVTHGTIAKRFDLRITDEGDMWNVTASLFEKRSKLTAEQKKANRRAKALVL